MNKYISHSMRCSIKNVCFYRHLSKANSNGQSYMHCVGKQPLIYRNIGQELERASIDYGNSEAVVSCHEVKRLTYNSLINQVDRVAAGLLKLGLQKGDYVGIWGPNTIQWYLTMLGAARAGLVSVCLNPAFQGPEIAYCLKKVKVKALVSPLTYKTQNFYDILCSICPEISTNKTKRPMRCEKLPHLKTVIIDANVNLQGVISFNELLNMSNLDEVSNIAKLQNCITPDAICNVQFTSGTTGQPKAAALSHFSFVNNATQIGKRNGLTQQRICAQVPLFHAFGIVITVLAGICHGASVILPSAGFNAEASINAVISEKCTVIHGTPSMYIDIINKQKEKTPLLSTLRIAVTGGAPCSPQLHQDIKEVLQVNDIRNIYGLTECSASAFQSCKGDSVEQVLHTVGCIQEHLEVKVVNEQGYIVPFGHPGELCIRGYSTMLGYLYDDAKTNETIGTDKWLRTGDQFILQSDGYGRIVGRLKEMIIRGGENIFPKEIEDFLITYPDIIEAHVIGVPDDRLGEEICAFIRLQGNCTKKITQSALKEYCKGKLAHFKIPRYVIHVNDFPKTTSGKIQKFKLHELFKKKAFESLQVDA